MKRLLAYVSALLAVGAGLELLARAYQAQFRAASHRSLFKAELLEQHLPVSTVFFGTSRTGEALRPKSFSRPAFNVSTPFSSLEILSHVVNRFAQAPQFEVAIIEVSVQQLNHKPLPWVSSAGSDDGLEGSLSNWVEAHSRLVQERKVFVFDSLARLVCQTFFSARFDGTEEFPKDYLAAIFNPQPEPAPSAFQTIECSPRMVDAAPSAPIELEAEAQAYVQQAQALASRGVKVFFYAPPTREVEASGEATPAFRALFAALAARTGRPVLDFAQCALPPEYYRDSTHLSHLGGAHFTHLVERALP